jgi:hypothetical protein
MGKLQLTEYVEQAAKGLMSPNEVTDEFFKKYNVINKNQLEGFRKKIAREKRYEHIMEYHAVKDMYMQMNHAEVGAFYKLLLCLQWNKEGVLYKDGKPMKLKELRNVTGLSDRQLRKILNRLEELDLLIKSGAKKDQEYIVNPMYVNIGGTKGSKAPFTRLYKKTGRYIQEKLKTNELGFLLKLSLFIDFKTLIIARDPYEKNPDKVVPLRLKDIAEIMGDSEQTTKAYIKALGDADILYEDGPAGSPLTKKFFHIHPQLVSRGVEEGDAYVTVLGYFTNLHKQMKYDEDRNVKSKYSALIERCNAAKKA